MRKSTVWSIVPLLAGFLATPAGAAEVTRAELDSACGTCHGPTGVSRVPTIPTIAGFEEDYFVDDMLAYRHGDINSPLMQAIARRYDRAEFRSMAAFYRRQEYVPAPQDYDPDKVRQGRALHVEYCGICHMDGGGIEAAREWSLPPLAGQWKHYLRNGIDAFLSGRRALPDGKSPRLKAFLGEHGPEGVDALLEYYASQQ